MGRHRYKARSNGNSTFFLNLTSMTDMFTILLVFLLQTYSTSVEIVNPVSGLRLPSSVSQKEPEDGIKLIVTKTGVSIEDTQIVQITNDEFAKADLDPNDPSFIKPLFDELEKKAKLIGEDKKLEGKILMQAERSLPYDVLRKVLYTSSMAGFPQLKMATLVGD
jgi:biopolymer transport protein ExbD